MSKEDRQARREERQADKAAGQDAAPRAPQDVAASSTAKSSQAPAYKPGSSKQEFEDALKNHRVDAFREMKGNIKDRTSLYVRRGHDRGRAYEESLKALYLDKAGAISAAFSEMREQQSGELESINHNYLINKHKIVLNALSHRFDLILDIAGNAKISTDQEAMEFADYGYRILQDIDIYGLIFDKDDSENKIMQAYVLNALGEKPQDKIELIERIDIARRQGKPIEDADLVMLTDIIMDKSGKSNNTMAALMLAYLDGAQRYQLLNQMMEKNTKGMPELIKYLTHLNYITRAQATTLAETKKDKPEFQELLAYLGGDKVQRIQARTAAIQQGKAQMMRRSYGHKNYAKDLFSLKGIASGLLFVNGAMTVGLNILVNLKNPAEIPGNMAMWGGAAMAGLGAQWSGGFGGLIITPEQIVARTTRGKKEGDEMDAEKQDAIVNGMRDAIGNKYEIAEFYFKNADRIRAAYDKNKKPGTPKTKITLEDLGYKGEAYDQLPESFKKVSKKLVNETITNWMFVFMRSDGGLGLQNADAQRLFINDTRVKQGLPRFETGAA